MLANLYIKNFALIDDLTLCLEPGLNIFTGETGAGKSIIMESLSLALGARSSASVVRSGQTCCVISAEFDITKISEVNKTLETLCIPAENSTLILRREIDNSGKSRAFANDTPLTLLALNEITQNLADIHTQNEHQLLLETSFQRKFLDAYGSLEKYTAEISKKYYELKELKDSQAALELSFAQKERLIDLYSFQLKEIAEANLKPSEDLELENTLPLLKNASKLKDNCEMARKALYSGETPALSAITQTIKNLEALHNSSGAMSEELDNTRNAYYMLESALDGINTFADKLEIDPEKLQEVMERLELIKKLKKKYAPTIEEIATYEEKIKAQLETLQKSEESSLELTKKIEKNSTELNKLCTKLSELRLKTGQKLAKAVETEIQELGMKKARFAITLTKEQEVQNYGIDKVDFIFSANPGEELKPIKSIASGGELSRLMLGLKTALSNVYGSPVLIFDEIDSGVGGPTGQAIGKKLKALSKERQILCITHLPQIAAFGDTNYAVFKTQKNGKTITEVKKLSQENKIDEIAKMLSGNKITQTALNHAKELIENSNSLRNSI